MDDTAQDRNLKPATAARIYDYILGGVHYFPADEEAARKLVAEFPVIPFAVRANRITLRRMVTYLANEGVRQFLDIGSGMPTQSSVHEVAQAIAPDSRVVYVDIDPIAVAESQELLEGDDLVIAVRGDLRTPQEILDSPQIRALLDFDQPIALLLMGVLHFIADDETAYDAVARLRANLAPGSYIAVSHLASETMELTWSHNGSYEKVEQLYKERTATPLGARSHDKIARFFDGCVMVEPDLVWITQWRPAPDDPTDFADDPRRCGWWAGLGRK